MRIFCNSKVTIPNWFDGFVVFLQQYAAWTIGAAQGAGDLFLLIYFKKFLIL